jgi:hypothetical protein
MHNKIYFYRITCPECGTVHYGFIGDNEDGNFYCNAIIEVKRGKNTRTEKCGYSIEKIGHLPEGSYENIATIKIKDSKPDIEYIKMEE